MNVTVMLFFCLVFCNSVAFENDFSTAALNSLFEVDTIENADSLNDECSIFNKCNSNGKCVNGKCVCFGGYTNFDCSISKFIIFI